MCIAVNQLYFFIEAIAKFVIKFVTFIRMTKNLLAEMLFENLVPYNLDPPNCLLTGPGPYGNERKEMIYSSLHVDEAFVFFLLKLGTKLNRS